MVYFIMCNIVKSFFNSLVFFLIIISLPLYAVCITDQDVEVGFSPGGTAQKIVLSAITGATKSIDIAAYSFTSKPIALALIEAKNRGVNIRLVADRKSNSSKYTAVTYLINKNVSVRLNEKYAIMHNKFMIIDGISVETGSFNYTQNAVSHNAENVICWHNRPDIANKYSKEFNRLWLESISIKPIY
ncbi:PLD-like domain-containing protein (plasmid) [Candidatus Erwinia haradaeae]|uniref:phospholipase D n=2 Tax=Candidatus Erwinia haradaeae TaxID=1922217 RepID=A0A451D327_9GAMM|nr:PLD-like domain-containing protein [Candidatus Erwinia haradaeae]VFP80068.1 PLD-like domain-containing protein [Candidatus Erwinia haradaeae]